tara:strand:- start:3371 stop:4066 length:696 start_codon:yes stop_codon:yes gene_type:complete
MLEVDRLKPNAWNPNEQSEETFNQLVEEIKEDGFDHPLNVVEDKDGYTIIGGEHRWRAACLLGIKKVPCYVHDNWNENLQKLKTVRRNLMTGSLNARKFTDLVEELSETGLQIDEMPATFGFEDKKEFDKYFIQTKEKRDEKFVDDLKEKKKPVEATDSLMSIVANIFKECGGAATVDQNYLFFTVHGSVQMAILCDDAAWGVVKRMVLHLKATGTPATEFISEAISEKLK